MKVIEYKKEDAALMVFLHGGGVSGWMWDEQISYFSTRYHCLVPDLPGHGSSREDPFSIQESAEKVMQLIEMKKSDKPVIVIGFSLGAQILVKMLSMRPTGIDVAIINSALTIPMKHSSKFLTPLLKLSFPLVKLRSFAKLQARVLYIKEKQFDKYFHETSETKVETFMQVMKENLAFDIPTQYSKSKAKILVTVGEKEKKVMKESALKLVQGNPNSTGVIIPKIGHGAPIACPEYFNSMVEQWTRQGLLPTNATIIPNQK